MADIKETLRIAIAGGGIGGVGVALGLKRAGFQKIDLYESASKLSDVGAGINVGPNLYRILNNYGVADRLAEIGAVSIRGQCTRRAADDKELAFSAYKGHFERYQAPVWVCHRAELHRCMVEAVEATGITLNLGAEITEIDFKRTALKYHKRNTNEPESKSIEYDLIIAADGVKSNIRRQMLALHGEIDKAQDTGQAAYRLLIPRSLMETDPELKKLIDEPVITRWIAHRRHIISYPINNRETYNISTAHPDEHLGTEESWTSKGSKEAMLNMWHDYCPRVQKMLHLVQADEILEWKLRVHAPLKTWIEGRVFLLGDASHPTLPHLAQGAAQAVEDGAVMATLLAKIKSTEEVPAILALVEKARKGRAEFIVAGAFDAGKAMHLTSAKEIEARDKAFEAFRTHGGTNPDTVADPATQAFLFGFDCTKEADKLYEQEYNYVKV